MLAHPQEVMSRFQQILVREVAAKHESDPDPSLRVADLYYELMPFEGLRGELGISSIFEYEQALMRLLAGQGGLLEMESIADRQKLQRHVQTHRFDSGLLRDFLNAGVRICFSPAKAATREKKTPGEATVPAREKKEAPPWFQHCPSCAEAVPRQARVSFCPFCGSDLRRAPCASCGEKLKLDWRFCIACGMEIGPRDGLLAHH